MKIVVTCFASCEWSECPKTLVFEPDAALLARIRNARDAVRELDLASASFRLSTIATTWYWYGPSAAQADRVTGAALHVGTDIDGFVLQARARFQDGYVASHMIPFDVCLSENANATIYIGPSGRTTDPRFLDHANEAIRNGLVVK